MAVIADNCPEIEVIVVDNNEERIAEWNGPNLDKLPIYEPGLNEVVARRRNKNLFFSTKVDEAISKADMIFISVNTPTKKSGLGAGYASDLKWVEASARKIAKFSKGHTIVVEKSTVPVKTAELIGNILGSYNSDSKDNLNKKSFSILSSPEFLAEGTAIKDLENPDRVLIGGDDAESIEQLSLIYQRWIKKDKILLTNIWSSELSKLTANAFLAQRISSINSISALCEMTGAEVDEVALAIGSDKRIGEKFLDASPGFGGSCFQKDILNLVYLCRHFGLFTVADYWEQVIFLNDWNRKRISTLIINKLFGSLSLKRILILGYSFKSNTNDIRESSAKYIVKDLLENNAKLFIHDPQVSKKQIEESLNQEESKELSDIDEGNWVFCENLADCFNLVDAIVILTEWDEYKNLDWEKISNSMRKPSWLFDTRLIADKVEVRDSGINYWGIGQGLN